MNLRVRVPDTDPNLQVCYLAGDNDQDGKTFASDASAVTINWNVTLTGASPLSQALIDVDLDGKIFASDASAITINWNTACP